jgi:hypothetical protein
VFLFVASLLFNGWFVAPPSEYETMRICKKAQWETERGFIGDAVNGKTKCTRDPNFRFDLDPNERAKGDDWMGTSTMGER